VDVPLGERLSLDVSGMFQWISAGDGERGGVAVPGTSQTGSLFAIRAGVLLPL